MSNDIKIMISAELDKASIGDIKKQLENATDGIGKINLEVDAEAISKQLEQASKTKPIKMDIDTGNAKSQLVDLNGQMTKFYSTSTTAMQSADGTTQQYIKTMYNADRSIKIVSTSMRDMETGKLTEIGRTVTENLVKPMKDAQVEALKLNSNFDKVSSGLKGELSNSLAKVTRDFKEVASPQTAKDIQDMIKSLDFSSSTFDQDVKRITGRIKEFRDESRDAAKEMKTLANAGNRMDGLSDRLNKLSKDFKGIVNPADISRVKEMIKALNPGSSTFSADVSKINGEISKLTGNARDTQRGLRDASTASDSLGQSLQDTLKKAVGWVSLTLAIRTFVRQLRNGVEAIKEIDSGMVELRKVTNATEEEYAKFATAAFETGRVLGRTGVEVINATADFARMGFELEQATGLAKEALLMMNVGDGIENLDHATKSMIATLKGFNVSGEDSVATARQINDAYNEVANNFAVDTGALAEGVRRISAVMRSSGNDMNETIGLLTGGFEVIQDSRKVSSGMNIIAQRLKGMTDEAKDGKDIFLTMGKQLKEIAGINLEKPNGDMKSTYQILSEMAEIFPTLTDRQRNYLTELSAGKRQAVVLEAILQNWENVEAATLTATHSMGSALVEQEVFLDSIEGKMNMLSATTQGFWNKVIDSNSVKGMVDMMTEFVRAAGDMVESMGGIETMATVLVPIIGIKIVGAFSKAIKASIEFNAIAKSLDAVNGTIAASSQGVATGIQATKAASEEASTSMAKLTVVSMGLKAALILIPAAIFAIRNAELKRKRALEDALAAFDKQKEQSDVLLELADAYEELGAKENKTAQETEVLAKIKERMIEISPEVASALDGENKSFSEQADIIKGVAEEQEKLTEMKAKEMLLEYGSDIDEKKARLKFEEESYDNIVKKINDYMEAKKKAKLAGEPFDDRNDDYYKRQIKGLAEREASMESLRAEIQVYHDAQVALGLATEEFTSKTDDSSDSLKNLIAAEAEAEEAAGILNDSMRESKEAMSEAEFGTSEYTAALREVIEVEKELKGINEENRQSGKRDYIEDIADKYKSEEQQIANIKKAREELDKDGKISIETQSKLSEKNAELADISGHTREEAIRLLEKENELARERIKLYEKEIEASAQGLSIYDMLYDGIMGSSDKVKESLAQAIKDIETGAKDVEEIWESLPQETKDLIITLTGSEDVEEGMGDIMELFLMSPESKEFITSLKGAELIEEDMEALRETWESLETDEKVFITRVLGEGIENVEGFEVMWNELSDEEKDFTIKAFADGVTEIEGFEEMWNNLEDEEKALVIKATAEGANNVEEFDAYWKGMNPGKKKFIAEAVGIKDVQDADDETMDSWSKNPLVKWFMAEYDGLKEVRVEQDLTDGQWKLHIEDRTYTSKEFGSKTTRDAIKILQDYWNHIPRNDEKTKTTRHVSKYEVYGLPAAGNVTGKPKSNKYNPFDNNWTGNKNFKGGLSFVGEKGRELLVFPDGTHDMTADTTELRNLPRGTRIFNNPDTEKIMTGEKIPGFAKGNTSAKGTPKPSPKPNIGNTSEKARKKAKADADAKVKAKQKEIKEEKTLINIMDAQIRRIQIKNDLLIKGRDLMEEQRDLASNDNTLKGINNQMVLTSELIEKNRRIIQSYRVEQDKFHAMANQSRKKYSKFKVDTWFDANAEQTPEFVVQFNAAGSKKMQDEMTEAFEDIQKLKKGWMEADEELQSHIKTNEKLARELDEIAAKQQDVIAERISDSKDWIEKRNFYDDWGADSEIDAWERVRDYIRGYYEDGILTHRQFTDHMLDVDKAYFAEQERLYEEQQKAIKDYDDRREKARSEWVSARNKELQEQRNRQSSLESIQEAIVQIIKKRGDAEKKALSKAHKEEMDSLNERHNKRKEIYDKELESFKNMVQGKIDALDEQYDEEDYLSDLEKERAEASRIKKEIDVLVLDDSLTARNQTIELRKELADQNEKIAKMQQDRERKELKKSLENQIKEKEKSASKSDEIANKSFEEEKKRLEDEQEKQKEMLDRRYENDKVYAEAREAVIRGTVEVSEGSFEDIFTAYQNFEDDFGKGLGILGNIIKEEFLDKLEEAQIALTELNRIQANYESDYDPGDSSLGWTEKRPEETIQKPTKPEDPIRGDSYKDSMSKHPAFANWSDRDYKEYIKNKQNWEAATSDYGLNGRNYYADRNAKLRKSYGMTRDEHHWKQLIGYDNGGKIDYNGIAAVHGESSPEWMLRDFHLKKIVSDAVLSTIKMTTPRKPPIPKGNGVTLEIGNFIKADSITKDSMPMLKKWEGDAISRLKVELKKVGV